MINLKYNVYLDKFNEFMEIRDLTANTAKNYTFFLKQYLTWVDANLNKPLTKVSYDEIRTYMLHLKNVRNLAPSSINAHISQLRFFYNHILNKPFDKHQVPFMKTTRKLPLIVSKKDIFYFIDSFKNIKHKAITALLYSSGIRVSELRYLRYEDISRKNMQLYIRKTKSRTDRYAILSKKALDILTEYWFWADRPKELLFPGRNPQTPLSSVTINNIFNNHCENINFPINLTPHLLRHHFGTHLYEDGNDLLTIQKLLGHKSIASTTIYVQLSNPNKMNIVSPFDRECLV